MCRSACARDQDLEPAVRRAASVLEQQIGSPVSGHHAHLECDAERLECRRGVRHRRPVGCRAHDDADEWFHRRIVQQLESRSHPPTRRKCMDRKVVADSLETVARQAVDLARRLGADQAEAGVSYDEGLSVTVRMGELESVERQRDRGLAVTVYRNAQKGSASTTDFAASSVEEIVRKALSIGSFTTADEYAGLADAALMAVDPPDLELCFPWDLDVEHATGIALRAESAARALDPRIANSEGATVAGGVGWRVYANSHGFVGGYPTSTYSTSCSVVAKSNGSLERDY